MWRICHVAIEKNFNFEIRRDHQKNFLWASRLWVSRRKEPILSYAPKNNEKKNSGSKGLLKKMKNYIFVQPFMPWCDEFVTYCPNFDFKIRRYHQNISYERRDYASVYENSLSQTMSRKTTKKRIQTVKGYQDEKIWPEFSCRWLEFKYI